LLKWSSWLLEVQALGEGWLRRRRGLCTETRRQFGHLALQILRWSGRQPPGAPARPIASKFADYDHAAIGRAMGCDGIRVERATDLSDAIRQAVASGCPTIVDVVTSGDPTFRDVQTPLAQYPYSNASKDSGVFSPQSWRTWVLRPMR
jgi:hypothetical protein